MGVTADQPVGMPTADDIEELQPTEDEIAEMGGDIDYSEIQGELEKAKDKISGKEKPKEPKEPKEKKSKGKSGASEDEMLDQLNSLALLAHGLPSPCHAMIPGQLAR